MNALLRRVLLEGQNSFSKQDPAFLNTPNWMWKTWKEAYGQSNCREIATTHLTQPALDLTVKSEPEFWAKKLNAQILPTGSLRIVHNGKIQNLKGFNEGAWWVQDTAASIPARVLIASLQKYKNPKILDLCAAPGGKTAQLATSQNGVIAVDRSKSRTKLLHLKHSEDSILWEQRADPVSVKPPKKSKEEPKAKKPKATKKPKNAVKALTNLDGLIGKLTRPMSKTEIVRLAIDGGHGSYYLANKYWDNIESRLFKNKDGLFLNHEKKT